MSHILELQVHDKYSFFLFTIGAQIMTVQTYLSMNIDKTTNI